MVTAYDTGGYAVRRLLIIVTSLALSLLSVGVPVASAAGLPLTLVKNGLSSPVYLTNAGDDRLFVVERGGLIKIIHNDASVTTFLDLSSVVRRAANRVC